MNQKSHVTDYLIDKIKRNAHSGRQHNPLAGGDIAVKPKINVSATSIITRMVSGRLSFCQNDSV